MNRPGVTGERCIALFLLGLLIFNPPLLSVFGVDKTIAGIPVLFFYVFVAWGFLVAILAVVSERARDEQRIDRGVGEEPDRQGY